MQHDRSHRALQELIRSFDAGYKHSRQRIFRFVLVKDTRLHGKTYPPGDYDYDAEQKTIRRVR